MKLPNYLLISLLLFSITNAYALNSTEQAIVEQVDKNLELSLSELEQAVNINSGTLNFAGVKKVGDLFNQQLKNLGFDIEWVDGASFNRAGHLVASYGDSGPKILMIGHLDTVFSVNDDFQAYTKIDDTHIAGPGITDMKGGDVIIISALRALKELNLLDGVSIKVVMTGDEESSGLPLSASKKALIDAAKWADIALGFENGDSNIKTAVVARRGHASWSLNVIGKAAHSSQIFKPEIGYGAIFETARILNEFREQLEGFGHLTFNPGMIIGGTTITHETQNKNGTAFGKDNVIAKTVKVTGGLRTLSEDELIHTKQVMQKIVSDNLAHTSAELIIEEGYPPMSPIDGNLKLLGLYSDVSESLGFGEVIAVNPMNAGAADISFTAGYVKMGLDGLGLMGKGGHTKGEVADITSLSKNTQKAAVLIYRLSQQP